MTKLSVTEMAAIETERAKKNEALRQLTSTSFNLENPEHLKALEKYSNHFELSANKMYLFNAMSTSFSTWGGSWIIGYILPLPEFVNYFLTGFLCLGTAGRILKHFSINDFYDQLAEMKKIYTWCMGSMNNDPHNEVIINEKLANSEIQRIIKLIAPLCTTDFIAIWKKESTKTKHVSSWSNTFSSGYTALSSTLSFFYKDPKKPSAVQNRILELKATIETRGLDLGVLNGLEQSIRYFATNPQVKELVITKLKHQINVMSPLTIPASNCNRMLMIS